MHTASKKWLMLEYLPFGKERSWHLYYKSKRKLNENYCGDVEMAQWLQTLTVLTEDLGLIFKPTHLVFHKHWELLFQKICCCLLTSADC